MFIILLIPARQYLMPRLFDKWTLSQLDAAEYEEAPPAPQWVIDEANKCERRASQGDNAYEAYYAEREAIDSEMPGHAGIRHHVTAAEGAKLFVLVN